MLAPHSTVKDDEQWNARMAEQVAEIKRLKVLQEATKAYLHDLESGGVELIICHVCGERTNTGHTYGCSRNRLALALADTENKR